MKNVNYIISATLASLITLSALPTTSLAAPATEQCFGIAKAHKNDCGVGPVSCSGSAKKDSDPNAYIMLPKGLCERIVGGNLKPQASE